MQRGVSELESYLYRTKQSTDAKNFMTPPLEHQHNDRNHRQQLSINGSKSKLQDGNKSGFEWVLSFRSTP